MALRISVPVVLAGEKGDPVLTAFADAYKRNFDLVKNPDTEVDIFFLNKGLNTFEEFGYLHQIFLNEREMYHAVLQAEKDGYDAVIPMCFTDPVVQQTRKAVDIPVIGQAETELMFAAMMGKKLGVITVSDEACLLVDEIIENYGYKDRAVKTRSIGISGELQAQAAFDASHDIEAFKEVSKELIADGAQVLVPGCSCISLGLRMAAGCEDQYPNGLREVDGVAVLDGMSVVIKMAENMASLKKCGSNFISRAGKYKQAPKEADEQTLAKFPYHGSGIWKA